MTSAKTTDIDTDMLESGNGQFKQLRQYLSDVVQSETEATEDRIEQYSKQQAALLKLFHEKAKQDFQDILRYDRMK